jgi:hypothetical protein
MLDRCLMILILCLGTAVARADDPAALELAERIAQRAANEGRVGTMHFLLTNKSGKQRERIATMAHSDRDESTRLLIHFTAPAAIRGTSFVAHQDNNDNSENWLFLPATERVRRIPSSQRSDYFLGTDLTYGDIEDNFKFGLDEWQFDAVSYINRDGRRWPLLSGHAISEEIAREIGYSAFTAVIDPDSLFPVEIDYVDADGVALKRIEVTNQQQIGGTWTAMTFCVINHQTRHRTDVRFEDMRYVPGLKTSVFDAQALAFGAPRLP